MASVLDSVDQRTQLVGQNRLELLLFRLDGNQVYGINVFKVREVLQCPRLTEVPQRKVVVRGIAHIRGRTIPIMDMNLAMGNSALPNPQDSFVIISEYNSTTQGFLVSSVERIVNLNWETVLPPPKGTGSGSFLTAVTEVDGKIVEIIDVEKILADVAPINESISEGVLKVDGVEKAREHKLKVLIADDSGVARKQIKRCIETLGIETHQEADGRKALNHLRSIVENNENIFDHYFMVISDIEMPEMDGYTLTTEIKADPRLSSLPVVLHTSLSGGFNETMVQRVGADDFLAKFKADKLADLVQTHAARYVTELEHR